MSPTKRVDGAAEPAAPKVAVDGKIKATDHYLEEKSAAPAEAIEKMLVILGDLTERMNRMEVSQREQDSRLSTDSPEFRAENRKREVGAGINIEALERSPPKVSPTVSPATYFGIRQHQQQPGVEGPPARYADP